MLEVKTTLALVTDGGELDLASYITTAGLSGAVICAPPILISVPSQVRFFLVEASPILNL